MISNKISTNPKESLLSKICHIGKRSFLLANCGPAFIPEIYVPDACQSKQDYPSNKEENNLIKENPPKIAQDEEKTSCISQKRFKPNLDGCRSRLACEFDEVKINDVIDAPENDIAGKLFSQLRTRNLWKAENEKTTTPTTTETANRKCSSDSGAESSSTEASRYAYYPGSHPSLLLIMRIPSAIQNLLACCHINVLEDTFGKVQPSK
jgi:hypothetical protein